MNLRTETVLFFEETCFFGDNSLYDNVLIAFKVNMYYNLFFTRIFFFIIIIMIMVKIVFLPTIIFCRISYMKLTNETFACENIFALNN